MLNLRRLAGATTLAFFLTSHSHVLAVQAPDDHGPRVLVDDSYPLDLPVLHGRSTAEMGLQARPFSNHYLFFSQPRTLYSDPSAGVSISYFVFYKWVGNTAAPDSVLLNLTCDAGRAQTLLDSDHLTWVVRACGVLIGENSVEMVAPENRLSASAGARWQTSADQWQGQPGPWRIRVRVQDSDTDSFAGSRIIRSLVVAISAERTE